jgi:hypothetical protein
MNSRPGFRKKCTSRIGGLENPSSYAANLLSQMPSLMVPLGGLHR